MKKKIITILLLSLLLVTVLIGCTKVEKKLLAMNEYTELDTLILSDIRFDGTAADDIRMRMIEDMVNTRNPDFIAITGNLVHCKNNGEVMKKAALFFDNFAIPWATSIGELDVQGNTSKKQIVNILTNNKLKYSMVMRGESYEYNYIISVVNKNNGIEHLFYFIDTSVECSDTFVEWYKNTITSISFKNVDKKGDTLRSQVFMNRPLPLYKNYSIVINNNNVEPSPWANSQIFEDAIFKMKSTKAVIAGYDNLANGYSGERIQEVLFTYTVTMLFDSSMTGDNYMLQKGRIGGTYYNFRDASYVDSLNRIMRDPENFKKATA